MSIVCRRGNWCSSISKALAYCQPVYSVCITTDCQWSPRGFADCTPSQIYDEQLAPDAPSTCDVETGAASMYKTWYHISFDMLIDRHATSNSDDLKSSPASVYYGDLESQMISARSCLRVFDRSHPRFVVPACMLEVLRRSALLLVQRSRGHPDPLPSRFPRAIPDATAKDT